MDRKLVEPSIEYEAELLRMRKLLLKEKSRFPGCGHLEKFTDISLWLQTLKQQEKEETALIGTIPGTVYFYVEGKKLLGLIEIRHRLDDFLFNYGGNIGYAVHPEERKKGYGTEMLGKVLPYCTTLGLKKVLITCVDFNPASEKIIRKNGGVYEDTRYFQEGGVYLKRFWI